MIEKTPVIQEDNAENLATTEINQSVELLEKVEKLGAKIPEHILKKKVITFSGTVKILSVAGLLFFGLFVSLEFLFFWRRYCLINFCFSNSFRPICLEMW